MTHCGPSATMDATETAEPAVTDDGGSLAERVVRGPADRADLERTLWLAAIFALLADVHTTYVGLQLGLAEGNPVVRAAMDTIGFGGLVLVKVAALGCAVVLRSRYPRHGLVIPLGLVVPWALAASLNALSLA